MSNVAASSAGATATSSSDFDSGLNAPKANDGNVAQAQSAGSGYWRSLDACPQWLQIDFSGTPTINRIDVYGLQDGGPVTPTLAMTSALQGLRDYTIEYWTGSAWATVPGAEVTGNTHVWNQFFFSPIATAKIRVNVSAMQATAANHAEIVEVEAYTAPSVPGSPSSPSPANGATGVALSTTLTFTSSGADRYDIYFGTSGTPPLVSTDQVSASYMTGALNPSTTYFWKVVAKNSGGSTTGSVWSFTTTGVGVAAVGIKPQVFIEVETGTVGGGWTDITSDFLTERGLRITRGINGGTPKDLVAGTGIARFYLANCPSASNPSRLIGYYSLHHANKRAGWRLGINCRIRMQNPNTGTITSQIVGRIDAIDPLSGAHNERYVQVTVADWMDEAARWNLTPTIGEQVGKRWDEILTDILAQMPRQPTSTSFDVGVEAYPYALVTSSNTKQAALAEFGKLAASEFGPIYVKADGTLRAESRHARLLHTSSDWTLSDTEHMGVKLPSTRSEVINTVRVQGHPFIVDALPTTLVYNQANSVQVLAGTTKLLLGSFRDPVTGDTIGATEVQPQIAGTDYIANLESDGTGVDATADFSIVTSIGAAGIQQYVTNSGTSDAYLTRNQFYGRGSYDRGTIVREARDSISVDQIGERVVTFDMYYQADSDVLQGAADYILSKYSSSIAQARTVTVFGSNATLLTQILVRDISDKLTISETVTGLNSSFFINAIDLELMPTGHLRSTYTLAPAADPFSGLYWELGVSTLGTNTLLAPF